LQEFVGEYRFDFGNFSGGKKDKDAKQPWVPWKALATRLKAGVKEMKSTAESRDFMPKGDAKNLERSSRELEKVILSISDSISKYQQIDNSAELDSVVESLQPTTQAFFLKTKGPELKLSEKQSASD